ncbi:hypothetical protein [Coleofasciculus sp. F4-SAH-05]|uniref:hypothetical protein n=1 Tax=Coleofasciculus sp. F4-SAH-05 TaxID=3069525 RepID=UPI0032F510C9
MNSLKAYQYWFLRNELKIYTLQSGQYQQVSTSPTLPILNLVAEVLEQSITIGRSPALRAFRQTIQTQKSQL